ncbi:MAG: glycosyltransferase [Anaerolinea sp.]|nr:glycosyltransferase [Anaerolinea sp.]
MADDARVSLALVVPVFNEEEALPETYKILEQTLHDLNRPYEVVVIDNGSSDNTEAIMQGIARQNPCWKYIRLSRNFGYQNSITAGMLATTCDAVIVIDADLQDPPELIPVFVDHWQQGYDIVYGVRERRTEESAFRIWATMMALRVISWMADYPLPVHSSDFRLITRQVRESFAQLPETNRYVRGLVHWLGYKQIGIPYTRRGRQYGAQGRQWAGAGLGYLISFVLDAVFSFSLKPLRVFLIIGVIVVILSVLLAILYVFLWIVGQPPAGFTTLLVLSIAHLGITALGIGVLGEYLGRTYSEVKRRPLWLIDYTLNFEPPASAPAGDPEKTSLEHRE